jgi:2-oxo-hept-3-ene-1,7-dioate hydratase
VLAGSFTRPIWVRRGDIILGDYRDLGAVSCRFV